MNKSESEFLGDMLSGARAEAYLALTLAGNSIWHALQSWGCPNPKPMSVEKDYWYSEETRSILMQRVNREAGYRIWRSIELFNGDPSHEVYDWPAMCPVA